MGKPEVFDHLHLVYQFTVPLRPQLRLFGAREFL